MPLLPSDLESDDNFETTMIYSQGGLEYTPPESEEAVVEPLEAFEGRMQEQTRLISGDFLRATLSTMNVPEYLEGAFGNFEIDADVDTAN